MNDKELDLMEERFSKAQQELMDKFKIKLKSVFEEVCGNMYSDVAQYAVTDAHINYRNHYRDYYRESLTKEITEEFSYYSYGHSMRMELLKKYPEQLQNKIISDLQDRIESLEEHVRQLQDRYR